MAGGLRPARRIIWVRVSQAKGVYTKLTFTVDYDLCPSALHDITGGTSDMGNCFGWEPDAPGSGGTGSSSGGRSRVAQDDPETRRQKMAEAAMKRQKEAEGRGLKDPEAVKAKQKRREEIERQAEAAGNRSGETPLKWTVS